MGNRVAVFPLAALVMWGLCPDQGSAEVVAIRDLEKAVKNAAPGNLIEIADGVHADQVLELTGRGTEEAPIVIRAATPGGVVLTGRSGILLSGDHLVLDGLWFREGEAPEKTVIALEGSHLRLTQTVIDGYFPKSPESREDKWVALRGRHHRVDHCTFYNKRSRSVTLTVWRETDQADHHVIEANHFHTRPKGAKGNGYESIRIGTSDEWNSDSGTMIRHNLFEKCDGEMEAVSIKAGGCRLESNTFLECQGTLTLRHGNGSVVSGNLFAGRRREHTGGVRVYGERHQITGNLFIGLTGRGGGALALQAGEADAPRNGYQPVRDVLVERNLFAANEGPAVKLDAAFGEDGRREIPRGVVVRGNTFSGVDPKSLVEGGERLADGWVWERNQIFADNQIPSEITEKYPPPVTRAHVGAEWFRERLP